MNRSGSKIKYPELESWPWQIFTGRSSLWRYIYISVYFYLQVKVVLILKNNSTSANTSIHPAHPWLLYAISTDTRTHVLHDIWAFSIMNIVCLVCGPFSDMNKSSFWTERALPCSNLCWDWKVSRVQCLPCITISVLSGAICLVMSLSSSMINYCERLYHYDNHCGTSEAFSS